MTITGKTAPNCSMPLLPILLSSNSQFSSALRRPRYAPRTALEAELESTPRRAFEMLASAACYLSLSLARKPVDALEAVQLLHDLTEELRWEGLQLETQPEETEDRIWQNKQIKWERLNHIEAATCFVKVRSRSRHCSQSLLKT